MFDVKSFCRYISPVVCCCYNILMTLVKIGECFHNINSLKILDHIVLEFRRFIVYFMSLYGCALKEKIFFFFSVSIKDVWVNLCVIFIYFMFFMIESSLINLTMSIVHKSLKTNKISIQSFSYTFYDFARTSFSK